MWTKELTKKLKDLGLGFYDYDYQNNTYIDIYNPHSQDYPDEAVATVCVNKPYTLDTNTYLFKQMDGEIQKELHKLLAEYSSTPEDERENPKQKYTYKHKYLKSKHGDDTYLAIGILPDQKYYPVLVDEARNTKDYQVLITNAEMEEYNKELGIDLDNYIKEEANTVQESNDYTEGRQVNL